MVGNGPSSNAVLLRLEQAVFNTPSALARAARYIFENPEKVVYQSLNDLSTYSKSGQASILRLCRDLGFTGFTEFKIALAAELAVQTAKPRPAAAFDSDPLSELSSSLSDSITETRELLSRSILERVAKRLIAARRIDLYGTGVSGFAAEIIGYRLLRVGLHANGMRDHELAHEVANGLGPNTAAIAVSSSGVTLATVEFLQFAQNAGAFTVALTSNPASAVAKSAQAVLHVARLRQPLSAGHVNDLPRFVFVAEALAETVKRLRRE
jgi:DNA-binding MurR/RpiR family transcriptional regulator